MRKGGKQSKAVESTGLVVEVNFSAKDCARVAERFLGAVGDESGMLRWSE